MRKLIFAFCLVVGMTALPLPGAEPVAVAESRAAFSVRDSAPAGSSCDAPREMPSFGPDSSSLRYDDVITGLDATNDSPTVLDSTTTFTATITSGTNVTYTWDFGDDEAGSGQVVFHTYGAVGTYTATVTATNEASSLSAETTVVIDEVIDGLLAVSDGPTATGESTAFLAIISEGTHEEYVWDCGDGSATEEGYYVTHIYPAADSYTVVVTANNSVSSMTADTTVTVQDEVEGPSAQNDSPTMLGSGTAFSATVTAGTDVGYTWAFGDGHDDSGQYVSHPYGVVGHYTATVTAANLVSSLEASTVVTITDVPISGPIAENDGPTILGDATTLTASVATGTNVAYEWTFGDGQMGSGQVVTHTYTAFGVHTATVTAANSVTALPALTMVTVTDEPIAGLSAGNDSPTALDNSTTFSATIAAGSNVTYEWAFGDGLSDSGQGVAHIYGAVGTYTATVTATNWVNQQVSNTVVLVQEPVSGLSAENDGPTELGDTTIFSATVAAGTDVSFEWAFGDGRTGSGSVVPHTYDLVDTYTATVTATNQVSFESTTTHVAVDVPIAGLHANSTSPTAVGDSTLMVAAVTEGTRAQYLWDFGDGSPTKEGYYVIHYFQAAGFYTTVVTASNSVSTASTDTLVVVQDEVEAPSAWNDSPTMLGNGTAFSATVAAGTDVGYTWTFGDGQSDSGQHVSHPYGAIGIYTATVTAANLVSSLEASTPVTITDVPIAGLATENDSPTVLGRATTLTASITAGSNATYQWAFGDGNGDGGRVVTHTYGAPNTYTATVTATNSAAYETSQTIVTVEEPVAGLTANNDGPTALGSSTTFAATVDSGSGVAYEWSFGDGLNDSGQGVNHTYAAIGTYTATITATNQVSRQTSNTAVLVQEAVSGLSADNDGPTQLGDTTTLTAAITGGTDVSFEWDFGDGWTDTGVVMPHTYGAIGTYTATVTATNQVSLVTTTTVVEVTDIPITGLVAENDGPTPLHDLTTVAATIVSGTNVAYEWAFGDAQSGGGVIVSHTYGAVGTYMATVTATNSASHETADTAVIIQETISGLAAWNDSPTAVGSGTTLTANVTAGSDVSYDWDFGDGQDGAGQVVIHPYHDIGTYTATVTAANLVGQQAADTLVTVEESISGLVAQNDSPTILGQSTRLTATISSGSGVAYDWSFGDGENGSGSHVSHTYGEVGTYTAAVTASNRLGGITATTTIVLEPDIICVCLPSIAKNFVCDPDPYEPNDDPANAYELTSNTVLYADFCEPGCKDEYKFQINSTSVPIAINMTKIPSGCDYDIYLYRLPDTSSPLAESERNGNADEQIVYQPEVVGEYMVYVYASGKGDLADVRSYRLSCTFE